MIDTRHPNFANTPVAPGRSAMSYAPGDLEAAAKTPAVAVITPFYNTGEVFHQTARCVLGQSLQQFEWLIINDGSSDAGALAVLERYRELARRDPRVRVIDHRKNSGLSAARNTGFREARAPYVFMLDSDDLIEPTAIEKLAWFLECNPAYSFAKGYTVGFEGQEYLWERGFHQGPAILEENIVTATTMVRRRVHADVGGFDETIRGGLEDWEFWLRCADRGLWGGTVPEYLEWYRRRAEPVGASTNGAWANLASIERQQKFRAEMVRQHPSLFPVRDGGRGGQFPQPSRAWHMPHADVPNHLPWSNVLDNGADSGSRRRRALLIVPWFRLGGADKFNHDAARMLKQSGWDITLATTLSGHYWLPEFTKITPDVFMLDHLAQMPDFPRLLRYLIDSRKPDVVMNTNSELTYLILPYLRSHCPGPTYVDYNHMEEVYWKNGGHPRHGAGMQDQLDLNIVSSQHLKDWMAARGADPARIEVCNTNVDPEQWKPDAALRAQAREELELDDDVVALLYPVRLTMQKQVMVFADSIRRLRDRVGAQPTSPKFLALVAGDGEDRAALEGYIRTHHLEPHIRMLGAVPLPKMPAIFNAADILFLPSMQEGIALSIFEAMATGKVVVGADVGGQRELVVEGTGYLHPLSADKSAEAEAYAKLLSELVVDPARRDRLGRAAREHVCKHHPLEIMGKRLQTLFELAAHHKRTQPRQTISPRFAHELAVAGLDWVRVRDLSEQLWPFRERTLEAERQAKLRCERDRAAAAAAVGFIEGSASWKLMQAARRAALRGPDIPIGGGDPIERLKQIRASKSYKVMTALKQLPPVSIVSRLRHGKDFKGERPEPIRED